MLFHENYFRAAEGLNGKNRLQFYDAVFNFVFNNASPELKGSALFAFNLIKPFLEKSKKCSDAAKKTTLKKKEKKHTLNKHLGTTLKDP